MNRGKKEGRFLLNVKDDIRSRVTRRGDDRACDFCKRIIFQPDLSL